mmetsp:Transcript_49433/g.82890  ORF Transcript_49433/g.82890 Transcript_49433/m.82890 type:complete len:92 (-) Transcript_49433:36-311(-)
MVSIQHIKPQNIPIHVGILHEYKPSEWHILITNKSAHITYTNACSPETSETSKLLQTVRNQNMGIGNRQASENARPSGWQHFLGLQSGGWV